MTHPSSRGPAVRHPRRTARRDAAAPAAAPAAAIAPAARRRVLATGAAGLVAVALFAALTARVQGTLAPSLDRAVRARVRRRLRGGGRGRRAARLAATGVGGLGDTLAYVPAAVAARVLMGRRGVGGGNAVLGAALAVAAGRHVFRWMVPRLRPPTHLAQWNFFASYPSGHSTGAMAVGLTAAHVLAAEGVVRPLPAAAAAVALTAAVSAARVATDEHWSTDVVGGALAGTAVAAAATLAYEAGRMRHGR